MNNKYLKKRLEGVLSILKGIHEGSSPVSNTTKGYERETFINGFLKATLPSSLRFGSGEITDQLENKSGQLDVVIEYPFLPSLPIAPGLESRLYLAEGVAAVIEIKSNLKSQWKQIQKTAKELAKIKRHFGKTYSSTKRHPTERIPFIAVGYKGWDKYDTVKEKIESNPNVDAILDLGQEFFYAKIPFKNPNNSENILTYYSPGVDALWGLICILNEQINGLSGVESLASNYTFKNKKR